MMNAIRIMIVDDSKKQVRFRDVLVPKVDLIVEIYLRFQACLPSFGRGNQKRWSHIFAKDQFRHIKNSGVKQKTSARGSGK